ncbi:MAG TPA: LysM peptidoglycan-binding domain-containing protein [Ktedonobacterales bacterium]
MGFSRRTTDPPIRNARLRDYRTLSLPALPPRSRRDTPASDVDQRVDRDPGEHPGAVDRDPGAYDAFDLDANWMGDDDQLTRAAGRADGAHGNFHGKYLVDAGPDTWRSASGTWRAARGPRRTLAPLPTSTRATGAPDSGADRSAFTSYDHDYGHDDGRDPGERRTGAVPAVRIPAAAERTAPAPTGALTVIGARATRARVPALPTRPALPAVRTAPAPGDAPAATRRHHGPPIWLLANLAILLVVGAGILTPHLLSADASAACQWYTVRPGDTLGNIGWQHHSSAMALARANHIADANLIFVGQRLCIPMAWFAQANSAPVAPKHSVLAAAYVAAPRGAHGLPAGEPCTQDRSIVWTVPVSRWAVPPGCFGRVFYPNPNNYRVNGRVIPGFGWCNWWPEALLRNPLAYMLPGHRTPRVGVMVFWAPQPGERTGHYGYVESIGTGKNTGWILISEMNMYWRGAGWAKVDYRYIRVNYPGATYLY